MALNFPNSPSLNDTHTHNGLTWVWNGSVWEMQGSGGASVTVSDNAPSSPTHGDMWWESDTGDLKIYYDESETGAGSGAFWVSANGADSMVGISTSAPTNPQTGDLWWDSDVAALYMYYNDGNSSQWVSAASGATGAQGSVGDAGVAGAQGATGAQGAAGATGAQGAQGAAGATGAQGAAGSQGAAGATGSQGATGSTGAQGSTGSTGAQGSTGPVAGSSSQVVYKDGSNNPAGSGNLTFDGTNLIVAGNLNVGGVLTYEDVTNIDSVGIITARDKIKLTSADGQIEATGATGLSINASGASAFARFYTANTERLRINSNGVFDFKDNSFTNVGSIALDFIKGDADDDTNITFAGGDTITFKAGSTSPALTVNTTQVKVEDNQKFVAGTGNDLQIYHNGSHSYIADEGSGELIISGSRIQLMNAARSEKAIDFVQDGAVDIYYNGSKKFQTKSDGVDITGELQCDSLDVDGTTNIDGAVTIRSADDGKLNLVVPSGDSSDWNYIQFYGSNGSRDGYVGTSSNGTMYLAHDGGSRLEMSNTSGVAYLNNNRIATWTDSNSFSNTYNEFGNGVGSVSNTGNWHGRVNVAGSSHARLDVHCVSDGIVMTMYSHTGHNAGKVGATSNHPVKIMCNGSDHYQFSDAAFIPLTNNQSDLGSASYRWKDIYTMDLQLSNEARKDTGGNDVDGTWGDWTLQEGEDDIFMINNRNGKKFRIKMEEV